MLCPDDGSELVDDREGVSSCRLCRGHAISGEAFARIHAEVSAMLKAEADRESGAYGRVRACPRCRRPMQPLRMGEQPAWLESCLACELLWVERLDVAVMERIERRRAIARAAEELGPAGRHEMANDIVRELEDDDRRVRVIGVIRDLLWSIVDPRRRGWWP